MIYITSDTHFGHLLSAKLRGFSSLEEMDKYIIDRWNKTVGRKDEVYHLGDFAFGNHEVVRKYRNKLNGKIHLVMGNHCHQNRIHNIKGLFSSISDIKVIKYKKQKFILCHYAMRVWASSHYNSCQLFGHSHGKLPPIGKQYDVGMDNNNFTPISLDQIIKIMEKQPDNINFYENKIKKEIDL